jgi:hypothetical protein
LVKEGKMKSKKHNKKKPILKDMVVYGVGKKKKKGKKEKPILAGW